MSVNIKGLAPGQAIVVATGRQSHSSFSSLMDYKWRKTVQYSGFDIAKVKQVENPDAVTVILSSGIEATIKPYTILWSSPLPQFAETKAVLGFVDFMTNAKDNPHLFLVEAVVGDIIWASAFNSLPKPMPPGYLVRNFEPDYGPADILLENLSIERTPRRLNSDQAVSLMAGDLFLAAGISAKVKDSKAFLTFSGMTILGTGLAVEDVSAMFAGRADRPHIDSSFGSDRGLGDSYRRDIECDRAFARKEPSEALVYISRDDSVKGVSVLGSSGITFFDCDDINDYLESSAPEDGLWVARRAKWWSSESHEGERDGGIECDWEPATPADFKTFGYTPDGLARELFDIIETDPGQRDHDIVAEAIAAAVAECENDRAESAARQAQREADATARAPKAEARPEAR